MKKCVFSIIILTLYVSGNVFAFDNTIAHPALTDDAIDESNLNNYLNTIINLKDGTKTKIHDIKIRRLLKDGSIFEDEPPCRASNHFHNPLRGWNESGMRDEPWYVDLFCTEGEYPPGNISSNIHWATEYIEPSPGNYTQDTGNEWDWAHAREYFYIYLTGKNNYGNVVAATEDKREAYLADSLKALGHVLHLLQDMAVPAHTRDDFKSHLEWNGITKENVKEPKSWVIERFEHTVKENPGLISGEIKPEIPELSLTKFWDANNYTGQDPDELNPLQVGLAEFTNMNFASKNTIFAESKPTGDVYFHPYPRKSSTNIDELLDQNLLPKAITSEDGKIDYGIYIKKETDGVIIDNFTKATYYSMEIVNNSIPGGSVDEELLFKTFEIDKACAENYAEILLPRAIGYSSALIDYFFRGKIEVTNPILGFNPDSRTIDTISLSAKNITEDDEQNIEELTDGKVQVVVKYKTLLEGSDDDYLYRVAEANGLTSLPSDEPIEFEVSLIDPLLINPLPIYITELQVFVVFRGKLGNEDDGIAVGFKDVIGIIFDENWENGLAGNYSWQHTAPDDPHNIPNGETINLIQNNMLLKENRRYADSGEPRFNDTSPDRLGKQVGEYPDGIPITQNTYIHFYLPDMSINEKPPADPGYTNDFQTYEFRFNNGLMLQFSQPGHFWYQNDTTAYYTWDPTLICIDNVYSLFERAGITIPEPLYLEDIVIVQQLLDLYETPNVEHIQHLELDFIRIVGDKPSSD